MARLGEIGGVRQKAGMGGSAGTQETTCWSCRWDRRTTRGATLFPSGVWRQGDKPLTEKLAVNVDGVVRPTARSRPLRTKCQLTSFTMPIPRRFKRRAMPLPEQVETFEHFRRLIHSDADLHAGISRYRRRIARNSVGTIVSALMKNTIYRGSIASNPFPKDFSLVKARSYFSRVEPEVEILWNAHILSAYIPDINAFVKMKEAFESLYISGYFERALAVINQIEERFGYSLWSIGIRFVLNQATGGLPANKAALDRIVSTPGLPAITAYLAFFMSYTAEDNVILDDIRRQVNPLEHDIHVYARYHLLPMDLDVIRDPTLCLNFELTSPIVDRFETFVEMSQLCAVREVHLDVLRDTINILQGLDDVRFHNLSFILTGSPLPLPLNDAFKGACDFYTTGDYTSANHELQKLHSSGNELPCSLELSARTAFQLKLSIETSALAPSPLQSIASVFRQYLYLTDELKTSRTALIHACMKTRGLRTFRAVASMMDRQIDTPVVAHRSSNELLWSLSSQLSNPIMLSPLKSISERAYQMLASSTPPGENLAAKLHLLCVSGAPGDANRIMEMNIPSHRALLYSSYAFYNSGNLAAALDRYNEYRIVAGIDWNPRTLSFQYAIFHKLGSLDCALSAFVDAYLTETRYHVLYPLTELVTWAVRTAAANVSAIDRGIALHAFSTHINTSRDGDLSDCLEDVLRSCNVHVPSDLIRTTIPHKRLVYFLRNVATIGRLEDTTRLDTVDDIELERIRILQWLVEVDPPSRPIYIAEVSTITKDQEVAKLSVTLEKSKIYIHEEGLRRKFEAEIKPLFIRYRSMIGEPLLATQIDRIDKMMRKLLRENVDGGAMYLIIPSAELDNMFVSMVQLALDLTGLDPEYGFKTYLSTRLLHGVLPGELQSSFINERLLISGDRDGPESFLASWSESLAAVSPEMRKIIVDQFQTFSKKIVDGIAKLKDSRIRVWSSQTPNGIFKIGIDSTGLQRLRGSLSPSSTYSEFIDRFFAAFWEAMDHCLLAVRSELTGDFRRQMLSNLDSLENGIAKQNFEGRVRGEFLDAIARCRAALSQSIDRVAGWFTRGGTVSTEPFSIARAVQVATIITNNCYPKNRLTPECKDGSEYLMRSELLSPLIDMLTNCFQNTSQHSGVIGRSPKVKVDLVRRQNGDVVITVSSEIGKDVRLEDRRREISDLVDEDDATNLTAVAGEGRTGIRKMKRILKYDLQSGAKLKMEVSPERVVSVWFEIPRRFTWTSY